MPLFTGSAIATPNTNVLAADRFATFCDFKLPDIARLFTRTEELEFPIDFFGDGKHTIRIIPYMIQQNVTYKTEHKDRPALVKRVYEVLARGLERRIESDMLHTLFAAGAESRAIFGYEKSHILSTNSPRHKFVISPETLDARFAFPSPPFLAENVICSHLLGKGQPFQDHMANCAMLKFKEDVGLMVRCDRPDTMVLTQLPHLPPLMGFNTAFKFDAKTHKVTQIPDKREGVEVVSIAYFCAIGVLDRHKITLLDIEN
jgi:hypothetical protein